MNFNIILYTLSGIILSLSRFWSGRLGGKLPINFAQIKIKTGQCFSRSPAHLRDWRQISVQIETGVLRSLFWPKS